jgi:dolichyl-phosphate-mannose-protein mannosyltransferase
VKTETRSRLYNSTGFFFLCWAAHYLPFYLMGRQLFLHHYLPAHLASCLVTGALVEFIFNVEPVLDDVPANLKELNSASPPHSSTSNNSSTAVQEKKALQSGSQRRQKQFQSTNLMATWIAVIVVLAAVVYGWLFFAPLTYGFPGLSVEQVNRRKWVGYDLHFAK